MRSRKFLGLVISVVGFGCAQAAEQLPAAPVDSGTAVADTAAAVDTGTAPQPDTGSFPSFDDGTKDTRADTSSTSDTPEPANCHLVINELQTGTAASGDEEFLEIYNPCSASADLSGWKINYRGGSSTTDVVVYDFANGATIAPKEYFVIGQVPEAGGEGMYVGTGFGKAGAVVMLHDGSSIIDAVGYGDTTSKLTEGTKALAPGDTGKTLARVPNGVDSDDNATDFAVGTPTPGAANP